MAHKLTEFVLSESGKQLKGIFRHNACDTLRNLPEILQCGLGSSVKQLPIFGIHIPQVPREQTDSLAYLQREMSTLVSELESVFGARFEQRSFEGSVELYRRVRNLSLEFEQAVARGEARFDHFAKVLLDNCFLPVEEQIKATQAGLDQPESPDRSETRGKVVLSGILPPPIGVSALIEEAGLRIVGNDIACLARSYAYTPERVGTPAEYYDDLFRNHHPCTTLLHTADKRIDVLLNLVEQSGAAGFIFVGEKYCEYEYFEYPYLQRRLKDKDIHTLSLEFSLEDEQNIGAVKTRIEAFAELIESA